MDIFPQDLISVLRGMHLNGKSASGNINRDDNGLTVSIHWNLLHTRTEAAVYAVGSQHHSLRKPPSTVRRDRQRMKHFMDFMDRKNTRELSEVTVTEQADYVNQIVTLVGINRGIATDEVIVFFRI